MADVKWIKIVTNIFDNRKVRQIEAMPEGDSILVIWFKLICLAGTINDNGMIYLTPEIPYTDEMLAAQFGRPLNVVKLALKTFQAFGMIEVVDNFLCLPSWEKYQSAEKLEGIRSKNAERQARYRERQRAKMAENGVTPALPDALPVTQHNALDIDIEEDIEVEVENNTILPGAETPPDPPKPPPAPSSPIVISIILNDKTEYPITEADVQGWKDLYPAVDVMQELRKMKGWADANPSKRKTKNGIKRFINAWLSKEQDRYHGPVVGQQQTYQGGGGRRNERPSGVDRLLEMIDRGDFDE